VVERRKETPAKKSHFKAEPKAQPWEVRMARRSVKKFKQIEHFDELTQEVKGRLEQKKARLLKELAFVEKLLKKPLKKVA